MSLDYVGTKRIWWTVSAAVILAGLISLLWPGRGLNLGLEFTSGSMIEVQFERDDVRTGEIRDVLNQFGLGGSRIQKARESGAVLIRASSMIDGKKQADIEAALEKAVGKIVFSDSHVVSASISKELIRNAFLALVIASVAMVIYITWRFEFKFAVTGIVALLHDALVTIGIFSLFGVEVSSAFVAAILTIIGYSINDTIVVYDRIRENLKQRKKETLGQLVNRSISETLVRSLNTAFTTFLAVTAVYVFGGPTTKDFALAMMIGAVSGTYSTIFIAAPLWAVWREQGVAGRRKVARAAR